ncbi:carboxylesterase/lipase family protein [soil metagenome]
MRRLAATLAALALAGPALAQDRPLVTTAAGPVRGVVEEGASVYKNIPFAAPPVGALRWKPPVKAAAWTAPRDAAAYGNICSQPPRPDGVVAAGAGRPQSEDCLNLNIWSPKGAKAAPVMVWIHGGAFRFGSGGGPAYDGAVFAHDGVVLVSINYRLGAMGWFAHPALTKAAGPNEPIGNYGLMDQIAALEWVKANIAAFGGDPANVTVFGESAGGSSVLALLATPSAKGLFAKAIVESGGGWQSPEPLAAQEKIGADLAAAQGLPVASATVEQLRALPVEKFFGLGGGAGAVGPFTDGRLMKETPAQAFAAGHAIDVPLIIGANSFEASLMRAFPIPTPVMLSRLNAEQKALYAKANGSDEAVVQAAYTDIVMGGPARWVAAKAAGGAPSFLYYFSYVGTAARGVSPGAAHGGEIVYAFGTGSRIAPRATVEDRNMESFMHGCWVGFAKTGRPVCPGQAWPAYTPAGDQLLELGVSTGVRTNFRKPFLDADQKAAGR